MSMKHFPGTDETRNNSTTTEQRFEQMEAQIAALELRDQRRSPNIAAC